MSKYSYGICITQIPYNGGASTLAYNLHKYFLCNNIKSSLFLFLKKEELMEFTDNNIPNCYILPYANYSYDLYDGNNNIIDIIKILQNKNIIIGINYGVIPIIKNFYKGFLIYIICGSPEFTIDSDSMVNKHISYNKFINSTNIENIKPNTLNKLSIKFANVCYTNSYITKKLYDKIYPKYKNKIFYSFALEYEINDIEIPKVIEYNSDEYKNREFLIISVASNWNRKVKNVKLLYDIYNFFSNEKKIIIGKTNQSYNFANIKNTTVLENITNSEVHNYFKKSKIMILTSLFDSQPNVVIEALINNCKVLTSNNVGSNELLTDICICSDVYNIDEWIAKILELKKTDNIIYNSYIKKNFLKIIEQNLYFQ